MDLKEELINLIKDFQHGNKDSFVQILSLVKEPVYKTIYAFVHNEENSIEVFDEVVYKTYINLNTLNHPEKIGFKEIN